MLTGPSFAAEISIGLPTALTLACADHDIGEEIQARLAAPTLRLYLTDDVVGAEMGGALKNVIAIACGATAGKGLGESARAALMTRGFAELTRIAAAKGGRLETMAGLSGLGDLALTCASEKSRNFAYGVALGQGRSPEAIAADGRTYEGAATAGVTVKLAEKTGRRGADLRGGGGSGRRALRYRRRHCASDGPATAAGILTRSRARKQTGHLTGSLECCTR